MLPLHHAALRLCNGTIPPPHVVAYGMHARVAKLSQEPQPSRPNGVMGESVRKWRCQDYALHNDPPSLYTCGRGST